MAWQAQPAGNAPTLHSSAILPGEMRRTLVFVLAVTVSAMACDDGPASPDRALTLTFANAVTARLVTAGATVNAVGEFDVSVGDPAGPGTTVQSLETRVVSASRGVELGRSTRPNGDYAFTDASVPAGGTLTLQAGIVIPSPPPRDELRVTVTIRTADGRLTERSARFVVGG